MISPLRRASALLQRGMTAPESFAAPCADTEGRGRGMSEPIQAEPTIMWAVYQRNGRGWHLHVYTVAPTRADSLARWRAPWSDEANARAVWRAKLRAGTARVEKVTVQPWQGHQP